MTQAEINRALDEASIGKIVLHDDRGGSGVWVCNLHFSYKPPPAGFYGEGKDPFAAIEDAARKIRQSRQARMPAQLRPKP